MNTYQDFIVHLASFRPDQFSQTFAFLKNNLGWLDDFLHREIDLERGDARLISQAVVWVQLDVTADSLAVLVNRLVVDALLVLAEARSVAFVFPEAEQTIDSVAFLSDLCKHLRSVDRKKGFKRILSALLKLPKQARFASLKLACLTVGEESSIEKTYFVPALLEMLAKLPEESRLPAVFQTLFLFIQGCSFLDEAEFIAKDFSEEHFVAFEAAFKHIPESDQTAECASALLKLIQRNAYFPKEMLWIAPRMRYEALIIMARDDRRVRDLFRDNPVIAWISHLWLLDELNDFTIELQLGIFRAEEIIRARRLLQLTQDSPLLKKAYELVRRPYPVLLLTVDLEDFKEHPVKVLQNLSTALSLYGGDEGFEVTFRGQGAYDFGGLRRQFLHELFGALVKTKYFCMDGDFYAPSPESEGSVYREIGNVFAYCLFIKDCPIGVYFKEEMFRQLLSEEVLPGPLEAMREGMRQSRFREEGLFEGNIAAKIQGEFSASLVVDRLRFSEGIPEEKQEWMRNWVKEASEELLTAFVKLLTGSAALAESVRGLIVERSAEALFFHTCGQQVDIPFDCFAEEKDFQQFFSLMVLDNCRFNAG